MGKKLVNMSSFGSVYAIRSPHLCPQQQEVLEHCQAMLNEGANESIVSNAILNKRPRFHLSKACTLLQTWENDEAERFVGLAHDSFEVRCLIFDGVLVQVHGTSTPDDVILRANTKHYTKWAVEAVDPVTDIWSCWLARRTIWSWRAELKAHGEDEETLARLEPNVSETSDGRRAWQYLAAAHELDFRLRPATVGLKGMFMFILHSDHPCSDTASQSVWTLGWPMARACRCTTHGWDG